MEHQGWVGSGILNGFHLCANVLMPSLVGLLNFNSDLESLLFFPLKKRVGKIFHWKMF